MLVLYFLRLNCLTISKGIMGLILFCVTKMCCLPFSTLRKPELSLSLGPKQTVSLVL